MAISEQVEQPESLTLTFHGDTEIRDLLKQWAKEDDRSVSAVVRRLIEKERQRRNGAPELIVEGFR